MKDTTAIDQERQRRGAELAADMRDAMSFPPLPPSPAEVGDLILQTREHVQALGWGNREQLYTASQVRTVMSECAAMAAARERDRCATRAWVHYMDVCKARRLPPSEHEHWNAARAVRRQAIDDDPMPCGHADISDDDPGPNGRAERAT